MENIFENNKLIAEFMDYDGQHEEWCGNNILVYNDFMADDQMIPYEPDKNWAQLMHVMEKIETSSYEGKQVEFL